MYCGISRALPFCFEARHIYDQFLNEDTAAAPVTLDARILTEATNPITLSPYRPDPNQWRGK